MSFATVIPMSDVEDVPFVGDGEVVDSFESSVCSVCSGGEPLVGTIFGSEASPV